MHAYTGLDPSSPSQTASQPTVPPSDEDWDAALSYEQHRLHGSRYHHLWMTSEQAALKFEDHFFDAIFIDGDHSYSAVATDIMLWMPKLRRPGGVIIFNDYRQRI